MSRRGSEGSGSFVKKAQVFKNTRDVLDGHRLAAGFELNINIVGPEPDEEIVERFRDALRSRIGDQPRALTEHNQKAICASDQHILGPNAFGDEVGGNGLHAVALFRPGVAIPRADFPQANELELGDVQRRPPVCKAANPFCNIERRACRHVLGRPAGLATGACCLSRLQIAQHPLGFSLSCELNYRGRGDNPLIKRKAVANEDLLA